MRAVGCFPPDVVQPIAVAEESGSLDAMLLDLATLGVVADWGAAVDSALRNGGGIGIVRGYRRLSLQLFPQDVMPPTRVDAKRPA